MENEVTPFLLVLSLRHYFIGCERILKCDKPSE